MSADPLAALAAQLRRPQQSFAGLARLPPAQLAELQRALDTARERQRRDIDAALRQALPRPLRALLLGRRAPP
jgi:hypothetical protein